MFSYRMLVVAVLMAASSCYAADNGQQDMTAVDFTAQKTLFVQQLDDGKTYSEITPESRKNVVEMLDRMDARLQKAGSVDRLSPEDRVAFFNDQEAVNVLLTKAKEDSKLICTRDMPTGTHHITTNCQTLAQRRANEESARREMNKISINGIPNL